MSNEMITTPAAFNLENSLAAQTNSFCSFTATDNESRAILFNGMNNPDHRLSDEINTVINVKHVFVEMVDIVDEKTGEVDSCPRIVLFDDKGESHVAVSLGVLSALKKLFKVFGMPQDWTETVPLKVKQVSIKERKMLTLEYAKSPKK